MYGSCRRYYRRSVIYCIAFRYQSDVAFQCRIHSDSDGNAVCRHRRIDLQRADDLDALQPERHGSCSYHFRRRFHQLFGGRINSTGFSEASKYFTQTFSFANDLGWFGKLFFSYGALVYIAIILAIITAIVIKKTRVGLNLRAVGENPATADAAGISVTKYKYTATLIGSMIAGLGGLFYIMDYLGGSVEYSVDTYGWMAVALVIFTVWRPNWAILGSIVFSMLYFMPNYISVSFAQKEIIKMIPYLVTIIVLVITSIISRRETQPPASLGLTYFREER